MKPKISTFNSIREQCSSFAFHKSEHTVFHVFCQVLYLHSGVKTNVRLKAKPLSLSIINSDNYSETLTTATGVTHIYIYLSEQDNYAFPQILYRYIIIYNNAIMLRLQWAQTLLNQ